MAPRQALGYDIGNLVADLFESVRRDHGDVTKIDLSTIRISRDSEGLHCTAEYDDGHYWECNACPEITRYEAIKRAHEGTNPGHHMMRIRESE